MWIMHFKPNAKTTTTATHWLFSFAHYFSKEKSIKCPATGNIRLKIKNKTKWIDEKFITVRRTMNNKCFKLWNMHLIAGMISDYGCRTCTLNFEFFINNSEWALHLWMSWIAWTILFFDSNCKLFIVQLITIKKL